MRRFAFALMSFAALTIPIVARAFAGGAKEGDSRPKARSQSSRGGKAGRLCACLKRNYQVAIGAAIRPITLAFARGNDADCRFPPVCLRTQGAKEYGSPSRSRAFGVSADIRLQSACASIAPRNTEGAGITQKIAKAGFASRLVMRLIARTRDLVNANQLNIWTREYRFVLANVKSSKRQTIGNGKEGVYYA